MGGYGGSFAQWVRSDNPKPYGSYGNGSAMRVSPVAHWYDNVDDVLDATAATALPSHNHPEGIKGAQTVALAIFKALSYHKYQEAPLHIDEILHECVEFSGYDINMPKASVVNKFDETCQGTVPVALKIISMATCYEDAVRLAVCLGADADTLGAIVGGIAEAIWGIPMKLRHQVEKFLPDDMQTVLHKFRMARPYSYKPLIDTCFSGDDFSDVSWDMLYDIDGKDAHNEIMSKTKSENARKRLLMAERAKARENW
jgi:ADP-ribosylglycohydrolase